MSNPLLQAMQQSIVDGDPEAAAALAHQAIQSGNDPLAAIQQGYVPGLDLVGEQFASGEMFLPDLVLAGEAMKSALAVLEPEMRKSGARRQTLGTIVLGTVQGDIHEIGKTLVGTMLSAGGFEVHDLGADVPAERFVQKAAEVDADIVGLSALLTTTMNRQREVIEALEAAGLRPKVKVLVGGAPVTPAWVAEIHADGCGADAIGAVAEARRLVGA